MKAINSVAQHHYKKIIKNTLLYVVVSFLMTSATAQTMDQFTATVFNTSVGATIDTDVPVSLKQSSNYVVSMALLTSSISASISTVKSRIAGGEFTNNNVTTNVFYHLQGEAFYDYIVTLPPYIAVTKPGVPDMIIDAPTTAPISKSDDVISGTLAASSGTTDFTINGTLDFGKEEIKGTYVGTFALVVNCN